MDSHWAPMMGRPNPIHYVIKKLEKMGCNNFGRLSNHPKLQPTKHRKTKNVGYKKKKEEKLPMQKKTRKTLKKLRNMRHLSGENKCFPSKWLHTWLVESLVWFGYVSIVFWIAFKVNFLPLFFSSLVSQLENCFHDSLGDGLLR